MIYLLMQLTEASQYVLLEKGDVPEPHPALNTLLCGSLAEPFLAGGLRILLYYFA